MMSIKSCVLAALLVLFSGTGVAASRFDSLDFYPNVEIFRPTTGDALEIVLDKAKYEATYNQDIRSFDPVEMKFDVVSKLGTTINYGLKLTISSHYCQTVGDVSSESELMDVTLTLDGMDFVIDEASSGIPFTTPDSRTHYMTLHTPVIEMSTNEKACYGLIGISATLNEGSI